MKRLEDFITVAQAAKLLKRDIRTVLKYIHSGDIEVRSLKMGPRRVMFLVKEKTLRNIFVKKCLWCGKTFRCKHPSNSRFCCKQHRMKHLYAARLKKK